MKTDKIMEAKKLTAAIAGVLQYIRTEEEAFAQSGMLAGAAPAARPAPVPPMNIWGISGRQAQMQLRSLMQIKAFHGSKII